MEVRSVGYANIDKFDGKICALLVEPEITTISYATASHIMLSVVIM